MIKTTHHHFRDLSFNQKAVIVITLVIGLLTILAIMVGHVIAVANVLEARKERIKAQEAKTATMQLAVETADMVALMATFSGWGLNSVANFEDRNHFYCVTLSNSVDLIRLTGKDPNDFASIRQLQGLVNYLKGSPGIINRPASTGLEHNSGITERH